MEQQQQSRHVPADNNPMTRNQDTLYAALALAYRLSQSCGMVKDEHDDDASWALRMHRGRSIGIVNGSWGNTEWVQQGTVFAT